MTDNEIIKALEWLESKTKEYCEQCAYINSEVCDICVFDKVKLALDLINRQKAEIERLREEIDNFDEGKGFIFTVDGAEGYFPVQFVKEAIKTHLNIKTIKAEAYKEFAERLKKCSFTTEYSLYDEVEVVSVDEIDNLLKEMVGDK